MKTRDVLASFKVYPSGSWYFYHVFVWNTKELMAKALKDGCVDGVYDCDGICCCNTTIRVKRNGKTRTTGRLGQIHFHRRCFSMGVITHESAHAALFWAKTKGIDPTKTDGTGWASPDEESFCFALGNIARQIVLKTERQWKFPGTTREVEPYV